MNWQRFGFVAECDSALPKKIREAHAALMAQVEKLNRDRAAIDARCDALKAGPLTPQVVAGLDEVRTARIVTWQTELGLRDEYHAWVEQFWYALQPLINRAFEQIGVVARDVTSQLVSIGYVESPPTVSVPGKIEQGMILRHPRHIAARARHGDLRGMAAHAADTKSLNIEAKRQTERAMEEFKTKLASVA